MNLAIIITAAAIGYCFLAGIAGAGFRQLLLHRCNQCRNGRQDSCIEEHDFPSILVGALWPLALPLGLGALLGRKVFP